MIRGFVPECFVEGVPDRIAFAHIDMNNAPAEIAALEAIEHRLIPGAMIVLDDFGATPTGPSICRKPSGSAIAGGSSGAADQPGAGDLVAPGRRLRPSAPAGATTT